jgi:hypothetical protein
MKIVISRTFTRAAIAAALVIPSSLVFAQAPAAPATPRDADGHPVLNGVYVGGGTAPNGQGTAVTFAGRGGTFYGFEEDNGLSRISNLNRPVYKPEYWETVKNNDYDGNWLDPINFCMPAGVPRVGMPAQIIEPPGQNCLLLVYQDGFNGYDGSYNNWKQYRWVWTDGRPHDPAAVAQEGLNGDAVGHWDGDTLVIETTGFTDTTWLEKSGWIHGFDMKVTERLTRTGNSLKWEATVEDPEYLQQPFVLTPASRNLNPNPNAFIPEGYPCQELDVQHETTHVRSG